MRRWLTVLLCTVLAAVTLGHCHRGAPYHNPDNGRFWTMDSFEGFGSDPASLHKYTYCGNNAVNAWDPSGHSSYTYAETSIASGISLQTRLTYGTMWGLLAGSVEGYKTAAMGGSYAAGFAKGFGFGFAAGAFLGPLPASVWTTGGGPYLLAFFSALSLNNAVNELKAGYYGPAVVDALFAFAPFLLTPRQLATQYDEAFASDSVVLRHGTTEKMAENLLPKGPDPDFVAPGDSSPTRGISFEPPNSQVSVTAKDYAINRAATHPEEGEPVVVTIIVPRWLVRLAHDYSADGEIRFAPGKGLEQLQKLWPYVRVKTTQKVNAQPQPKNPAD